MVFGLFLVVFFLIVSLIFLVIWFLLAPKNYFFTFVKEGSCKIVVKGDAVAKMLIQWTGYTFKINKEGPQENEEDNWEVVEGKEKHLFGGLRFYGFWPIYDIFIHRFKWKHLHEDGTLIEHDEIHDYVLLKEDLYVVELPLKKTETGEEGAEDINGVPLGIKIVVPIRIVNPYIAVFRVRRWLPQINGILSGILRLFVGNFRYREDLINMRAGEGIEEVQERYGKSMNVKKGDNLWKVFWEIAENEFSKMGGRIEDQNKAPGERFVVIFGVKINEAGTRILEIVPGSEYRRFTTMEYEAEREKKAIQIKAEAEKIRLDTIYRTIQEFGDVGKLIRTLEALEKSPERGAKWIIPLPNLAEFFRQEGVTREEIKNLRELIEKMLKEKK